MNTLAFNPNLDRQHELAEKARRLSERIQGSFYRCRPMFVEVDSRPPHVDSGMAMIEFRNHGFRIVARSMLGSLMEHSDTSTTGQELDLVDMSERSPLTELGESDPEWEVPTIEHTWTVHSCQVREITRRFNDSIHADH